MADTDAKEVVERLRSHPTKTNMDAVAIIEAQAAEIAMRDSKTERLRDDLAQCCEARAALYDRATAAESALSASQEREKALRALVAELERSDWQSIRTAPKHEPISVLYEDGTEEDEVYWSSSRCCMLGPRAGSMGEGWVSTQAGNLPVDEPTHWRPIRARALTQEGGE